MTSDGLPRVTEMLLEDVGDLRALCLTAKGFWTNPEVDVPEKASAV